mgnify:CR=1 FL=1
MRTTNIILIAVSLLAVLGLTQVTSAQESSVRVATGYEISTVAAGGYDVVAYYSQGKPVRGSGDYVATFGDATYLFASKSNRDQFQKNPSQYVPAYGGYCAYGVAVGKKLVGDPEIWKIVDEVLYLNLNKNIQNTWNEDIPGNIVKADDNWPRIRSKSPAEL